MTSPKPSSMLAGFRPLGIGGRLPHGKGGRPPQRMPGGAWSAVAVVAVLVLAVAQTLRWVFLVPIYQSPDEPVQLDYALAIWAHGKPFVVQNTLCEELPESIHPYTSFLSDRAAARDVTLNHALKCAARLWHAGVFRGTRQGRPADRWLADR